MAKKKKLDNINNQADEMLKKIDECISTRLKGLPSIKSAVIKTVNEDGSVDVYFPPDEDHVFTRIQNQSIHVLVPGDSVELLLKDGTYSNCWVIARHKK